MHTFQRARLKLTAWYILISFVMLTIFSLAAITAEKNAFAKIEHALGNRIERPHLTELLDQRITNFETVFIRRLIIFDAILLVFSAGASWFLSGKTLKPIQDMLKAQEAFAADVSHELRTPLTTVTMEIEALTRTTTKMPPAYQQTFSSIQEEIKRMTKLVEGLLISVRTTKQPTKLPVINLSIVTDEICGKLALLAKKKRLRYTYEIDKNICIKGNSDEIQRLLTIFIENAMQYTPSNGKIFIKLHAARHQARLIIQDSGIGIGEGDLPYIFDRFYRGTNPKPTTQEHTGTGLGLSIATQIVKKHKGEIRVTSKVHHGSTFTIIFPLIS